MSVRRPGRVIGRLAACVAALAPVALAAQRTAPPTSADTLARGRAIFASTCRACHTVNGSAQAAPPMAHIAQRYVAFSGSRVAAASRIVERRIGLQQLAAHVSVHRGPSFIGHLRPLCLAKLGAHIAPRQPSRGQDREATTLRTASASSSWQ